MTREICFDTETTGLDTQSDRVYEIGVVELIDGKKIGEKKRWLINPERKIPSDVKRITNITDEELENKPIFKDIYQDFLDFIANDSLVGHNAKHFDIPIINHELLLIGEPPLKNNIIDTLEIAKKKVNKKSVSLDSLCKEFKIDLEERKKNGHGALLDAELLLEVYINLKRNEFEIFDKNDSTKKIDDNVIYNKEKLKERIFSVSEEEEKLHNEFMKKNIKNST